MAKLRKVEHIATEADRGARLDQVIASRLALSKSKARMLIVAGAVYLNGRRVRIASKSILPGAKLVAWIDDAKLAASSPSSAPFELTKARVIYEDEWLIAVDKPPGLPTQPTLDEARANLYGAVKRFLTVQQGKPAYLGLHHRLDRDTSGVILFTKAQEANAGVGKLFSEHLARKTYLCVVPRRGSHRPPSDEWSVKNHLARDGRSKSARMKSVKSGGDFAHTDFRMVSEADDGNAWLIEARPRTGRMHQIRVHLAEAGLAILGDAAYRGATSCVPMEASSIRVMLHAVSLTFPHPITSLETSISAPIPEDFNTCLVRLRIRRKP